MCGPVVGCLELVRTCAPQVYGPESSGKTTLALHAIAEVQRQGGVAALIDAEHAFDPEYSRVCSRAPVCAMPLAVHGPACPIFSGRTGEVTHMTGPLIKKQWLHCVE